MRLKSLQMQGFKSFPDKIQLTFDVGLTAVVGPNGSGKSNIGDAVRWVLGEQSSKNLRGNKMEDVIFAGTKSRSASGFAMVTLTIDNMDRTLNINDDAVAITRKLYRSGDSEYLINGKPSRLKDVTELFMDTGLGKDGYSIIGQGKIAEIVSAKSSERREIFEEASGISKFRYKKSEAEKKLSLAQDNMLRLNDIVTELKNRIEPLKEQSEKARQFVELSEHRKSIEVSVWLFKINDLRSSLDGLRERIKISNTQYETLETQVEQCELDIQQRYFKMQESSAKAEDLQTEILHSQQKRSEMNSNVAVYQNDIEHAKQKVLELNHTRQDNESIKQNLIVKVYSLKEEISKGENALKNLAVEVDTINEKVSKFNDKVKGLDIVLQGISKDIMSINADVNVQNINITSADTIIRETQSQLDSMNSTIKEVESLRISYLEEQKEAQLQIKTTETLKVELNNRLNGFERLLSSKTSKLTTLRTDYENITLDIKDKQHRIKLLKDLENSMEGFSKSVKLVMKSVEKGQLSGVFGTVAQLLNTQKEYTLAIETALGGATQNIVVQNEETAKRCIKHLKDIHGGRATFLPISSIQGRNLSVENVQNEFGFVGVASDLVSCDGQFDSIKNNLLGRIVVMEDIDCATVTSKRFGYRFKIVTLDGQVINAGGSFTGGSTIHSSGIFSRKVEIDSLELELKNISAQEETLRVQSTALKSEVDSIQSEMESLKKEIFENSSNSIRLQAELKRLKDSILQCDNRLSSNDALNTALLQKVSQARTEKSICQENLKRLCSKLETLKANESETLNSKDSLIEERSSLLEDISQLRVFQAERSKDMETLKHTLDETSNRVANLEDTYGQIGIEIANQEKTIQSREKDILDSKFQEEELSKRCESLKVEISKWQSIHREHEEKVSKIRLSLRTLNDDKEGLSKELIRLEERKNTFQRDYDDIISQLFDTYEMTFSEAERFATPVKDIQSAQRELAELKSKIKSLGHVNVSAIDEYREVSERYKFMNEQLADTKKSKVELEKLICDLTNDMQTIFVENFYKINENFKQIFVELFGGGSAELVLTNTDDVLNSGIEIVVAPPGKVIKNLISLSGGEQAFVAIAIYFAILKVKPSPFCILDEIDAPLDEVNVRKYAVYLNHFIDKTQFIVVTHRRGTMESANVLYGVTMQKDGVSKLLKMEQKDIPNENF
ncbi:MAG: chromosome segregation protein SMC [Ruminococcus sp.]|nr:chromosome segregation protein SMC [Ruminococcus sp.]